MSMVISTYLIWSISIYLLSAVAGEAVKPIIVTPPPRVRATIEDITDEPGSIAAIEYRSEKMLLLTWHDSSEPTKEPVCDFVTPRSLPQHDSSTPCKDYVCESITPRCMPHCMLTPPTDESVIKDVMRQLSFEETELDGEAGFGDVARSEVIVEDYMSSREDVDQGNGQEDESAPSDRNFFYDDEGIDNAYKTQYDVQSSEDAGTNDDDDDDDEDDGFLVNKENEIVEPDVDVHLFSISMDVPFDNISITNLVPDDVLEREDVDVINADGFDSDPGNDNETKIYYYKKAKDRVYLHFIESRRNLKLYKNDSVRVRARCDGKVHVFTMSQCTGPTDPNYGMEAGPSGSIGPSSSRPTPKISMSKAFRAKAKAEREIRGDHVLQYSMLRDYVVELQSTNPNTTVKIAVERNIDPSLPTRGPFPCQVLAAVGLDSNNGIYLLVCVLLKLKVRVHGAEPTVGQDGSGGSGVGDVIGLSIADYACGAGVGVGSQCSSHTRWTKKKVETVRISLQKTTPTQSASQPSTNSQVPVTETKNVDGREMGDGIPTQSNAASGASEWSFMSFKKISPLAEEIIVMIRKHIQKTKAASYKAKLMHLEDDMGWYTTEMRARAEKIADDLRDIAYYIVEKVVKKYIDEE
ncbi:hypothetical protein Tco_0601730 [Tanacetum coccineum]